MEKSLEEQWLKKLATDDKKAYEIILKAPYQSVYLKGKRIKIMISILRFFWIGIFDFRLKVLEKR
jgi:hypothetical protein